MDNEQKTKIIATLGDPTPSKYRPQGTYENGIYDERQNQLLNPTLQHIVDLFFEHGVDVIRINLAHIEYPELGKKFREIKTAILLAEKNYGRRIGVLIDLPGPKIRFESSNWIIPTDRLHLSFKGINENLTFNPKNPKAKIAVPKESIVQINLDELPFYDAAPATATSIIEEIKKKVDPLKENPKSSSNAPLLAFIGDNDCTLKVVDYSVRNYSIICEVISVKNGKRLVGSKKGFTVRGIPKPIQAFTKQDEDKLSLLLAIDYEMYPYEIQTAEDDETHKRERIISHVGISFCQYREDVRKVAYHIVKHLKAQPQLSNCPLKELLVDMPLLIAKIETERGALNIDEILDIADGAMIARGDLALEIETARLPEESKRIMDRCNLRGKPVIMATQMLESMKTNIECSRPEATDVFDAVIDGADALLLSGETSSGKFPAPAILKMRDLACRAERFLSTKISEDSSPESLEDLRIEGYFHKLQESRQRVTDWRKLKRWNGIRKEYETMADQGHIAREIAKFVEELARIKNARLARQISTDRISHAACIMSSEQTVEGIIAPTKSGRTARMLARFRPSVWIYAQPHSQLTARKLAADRGVKINKILPDEQNLEILMKISKQALGSKLGKQVVIFTCGTPLGIVGTTNLIQRWDPSAVY